MDLSVQYAALNSELGEVVSRALSGGRYVLSEEVDAFEHEYAAYCGVRNCVGVGSGSEALHLALRACDIGAGDEVITVANSAAATALAISWTGATPVFVDIDPQTYTMDVEQASEVITQRTRAILPVHLYGHPADMEPLEELAGRCGLRLIEDACQAHGAAYKGRKVGGLGHMGCFSFYPTKNLGACGDAGAITTNDDDLADRLRLLRNYGQADRYHHQIKGFNSRLDELQAAILRVKLKHLDAWNRRRRELACVYDRLLGDLVVTPGRSDRCDHVYHLYVIQSDERDPLRSFLAEQGVDTLIHYPVPIHKQPAYADEYKGVHMPVTERTAERLISLPLHPYLDDRAVHYVAQAIVAWKNRGEMRRGENALNLVHGQHG